MKKFVYGFCVVHQMYIGLYTFLKKYRTPSGACFVVNPYNIRLRRYGRGEKSRLRTLSDFKISGNARLIRQSRLTAYFLLAHRTHPSLSTLSGSALTVFSLKDFSFFPSLLYTISNKCQVF